MSAQAVAAFDDAQLRSRFGVIPAVHARAVPLSVVARSFPRRSRAALALSALGYWVAIYGGFALYARGVMPAWLCATAGFFLFVRYYDLKHDEFHASGGRVWQWLSVVFTVSGPLQLGYTQLAKNHHAHHAFEGTARDPDVWLTKASVPTALLHGLTQPEQSVIRYVRQNGVDRRLLLDLSLNFSLWAGLAVLCSWQQFLLYNAVIRLANGVSWFFFFNILHRPIFYSDFVAVPFPRWVRVIWTLLLGRNNLTNITYHYLHHAYGFVRTEDLPDLSAFVQGKGRGQSSGVYAKGSYATHPLRRVG